MKRQSKNKIHKAYNTSCRFVCVRVCVDCVFVSIIYLCIHVCVNAPFDFERKGEKIMECNQARAILCGNLDTARDCIGF